MEGFIDIHSHCLCSLDDGAHNIEETKIMLKEAYQQGIRTIITTPHFHHHRGHASKAEIDLTLDIVQEAIQELLPGMKLYTGNELYYTSKLPELLQQEKVYTMAESQYVLIEFSPKEEFAGIRNGLYEIQGEGYWPILAHVERYECFQKNFQQMEMIYDMGIYLQVNANSITNGHSWGTKQFIKRLLKEDMIHFIATDAHDAKERKPEIAECINFLEKKCGKGSAERYFTQHPQYILEHQML
ncbi:MAG: CpsB/CapC family capsule biosynthesis tyrosine phosphatase [Lachnospiraceae bacterium]